MESPEVQPYVEATRSAGTVRVYDSVDVPGDSAVVADTRSIEITQPAGLGRRFNLLWAGQAISQLGDYLPYVSLPLFVKYLTDGTFAVALSYALEVSPAIIVGFVGGVLLDRWRLPSVMIVTDLLRAVAFAILASMAASTDAVDSGMALVAALSVAFVAGTLTAFFSGALFSLLPRLVTKDQLPVANSRIAASQNLANILGPAAAGVLIAALGFWPTFAINSLTFVVSAVTVALMGPVAREIVDVRDEGGRLRAATAGMRFVLAEPRLRYSTLAVAAVNLLTGFAESTFVIAFDEVGASKEWQQGFLFATFGAGALLGSVAAPRVIRRLGNGKAMTLGFGVFGLLYLLFVNGRWGAGLVLSLFFAFMGFQFIAIAYTTIRQAYTPSHLLGRVATASRALAWSTLPVGALGGAILADQSDFGLIMRLVPVGILVLGAALLPTVVWRDTP